MTGTMWALPGAQRWLDRVDDAIHRGASVLVPAPPIRPTGLLEAVAGRVRHRGCFSWHVVKASECSPAAQLADEVLGVDREEAASWGAARLAAAFVDQVVAITAVEEHWPAWRRLIEDYCHASRVRSENRRGVLFVILEGAIGAVAPQRDVGIDVVGWRGILSSLDVLLYATERVSTAHSQHYADVGLHAALAGEIGGYDLAAVEALASLQLSAFAEPEPIVHALGRLAAARGWQGIPTADLTRYSGRIDEVDGRAQESAVSLAARGDAESLRKRMWRAEVRVLFPFIEEVRSTIVQKHRSRIKTAASRWGFSGDVEELEVGDLVAIGESALPRGDLELMTVLRRARNALAHLQLADIACLGRRPVVDYWRSGTG